MNRINPIVSKTIDNLRLPLILGVVLIHSAPYDINTSSTYDSKWLVYFLCNDFVRVCVPLFFFISAYLLFANIKHYTKKIYISKVKGRTRSLLIPYLIWNFVVFILYTFKTIVTGNVTSNYIINSMLLAFIGQIPGNADYILEPYNIPFDFPLWFLRDLYVYILISPAFYYLVKKAGSAVILVLSVAFLIGFWPQLLFFNINGVLFFSLGTFFAVNNIDLTAIISNNPKISNLIVFIYPALICMDVLAFSFMDRVCFYAHTFQILWGFVAVFILFTKISIKSTYHSIISGQEVFAIYVMHGIFNNYLSKLTYLFNINSITGCLLFIVYDFCGMILLSLTIFYMIKRVSPRLTSFMFGKRNIPAALIYR